MKILIKILVITIMVLIISPEPVVNRIDFLHDDKELREEHFDIRITMWRVYFSRQSDCRFSDHL